MTWLCYKPFIPVCDLQLAGILHRLNGETSFLWIRNYSCRPTIFQCFSALENWAFSCLELWFWSGFNLASSSSFYFWITMSGEFESSSISIFAMVTTFSISFLRTDLENRVYFGVVKILVSLKTFFSHLGLQLTLIFVISINDFLLWHYLFLPVSMFR